MSLAAGLYVAGTVYNMYQQGEADKAQAAAERRNAAFFKEQAAFAKRAGERQEAIFARQTEQFIDEQIGRIAKSGVNFSGDVVDVVAQSEFVAGLEAAAIREETDFNVRLATMRGIDSLQTANAISSGTRARQIGIGLTGAGQAAASLSKTTRGSTRGNTPDGSFSGPNP